MTKSEKLNKLNREMLACSKCALRCTASRVVPGSGSAEAEIMLIGEAPGKKEDELGVPFVGSAGKFLDEMLASINMSRREIYPHTKTSRKLDRLKNASQQKNNNFGVGVYIANITKCRPPENRDPFPEEVEACWPWLEKQIKIINPKVIVTLGRHSLGRFVRDVKISEAHGKVFQRKISGLGKRYFYALYHPAAALYNSSMRETLLKDFKKIPKVLEKIKKENQ